MATGIAQKDTKLISIVVLSEKRSIKIKKKSLRGKIESIGITLILKQRKR